MLSNSGITVLPFANKVGKVQLWKFVYSLYGVPRTLHLVSEVGFTNTLTDHRSFKMVHKTLEELTRDQLREELYVHNQPVRGSKEQLQRRLTGCLEKEGPDPREETFEVEEVKSTSDPLAQILEKLSIADQHFASLGANLAALSAKADQQQEHPASIITTANQQQEHVAAQQQQVAELRQEVIKQIPKEVQQQVCPLQQELETQKTILENQKPVMENQKTTLEKLEERLNKVETRPQTIINQTSDGTRQAVVIVGKPSTFKIPTFDETDPWELYHK